MLTPGPAAKQAFACFAAFDVIASSKADLAGLMRVLTERARFLTPAAPRPTWAWGSRPRTATCSGPPFPPTG